MKIGRKGSEFTPIVITLETEKEAAMFKLLLDFPGTISTAINEAQANINKLKVDNMLSACEVINNEFSRMGITWDTVKSHFEN